MNIKTQPQHRTEDFGLIGWLKSTRIRLPLKGMDCRFEVSGEVASVTIEQVFHNDNRKALNCLYSFPLPGNAAVYRCELQVGQRVIVAKIEEQAKAREIYEEKVKAGHRASLVEVERDNLFTLSLGNVQPNDVILVRFAYFQTVERTGQELSLMIPFCPGVKYIPGRSLLRSDCGKGTVSDTDEVPDASRITPPRIDAFHPEAAIVTIEGRLQAGQVLRGSVESLQHFIDCQDQGEDVLIHIDTGSAVPDRDFVLRWLETESATAKVEAWLDQGKHGEFGLVRLVAPKNVPAVRGLTQDHYFLVDRSGSMNGEKWTKTAEALVRFVRLLDENDRVWITFFESNFKDYAERPLAPSTLLADQAFLDIESIGTGGGTELRPALHHVLATIQKYSAERLTNVILITDGQVGNESAILGDLRKHPRIKVHSFGIDTAVNDAFLRSLARQQHGRAVFQTPNDDLTEAISSLGAKLQRPVVVNLHVNEGWELADNGVADLYEADIVTVPLKQLKEGPLQLTGKLPDGSVWECRPTLHRVANPAIPLLWAKQRIEVCLDAENSIEAIALSKQFNLVCKGTAFIAWDEHEKVRKAKEELYNPSLNQAGDTSMIYRSAAPAPGAPGLADRTLGLIGSPVAAYAGERVFPKGSYSIKAKKSSVGGIGSKLAKFFGGGSAISPTLEPLQKHPLFVSTAGAKFLKALDQWLGETTGQVIRVMGFTKQLVNALFKERDNRDACLLLCRDFVRNQVADQGTREKLLKLIDTL